jgi:hypothetical protein
MLLSMRAIEDVMLASGDPNDDRFDTMSSFDASWSGSRRNSEHERIELQLSGHRIGAFTFVASCAKSRRTSRSFDELRNLQCGHLRMVSSAIA